MTRTEYLPGFPDETAKSGSPKLLALSQPPESYFLLTSVTLHLKALAGITSNAKRNPCAVLKLIVNWCPLLGGIIHRLPISNMFIICLHINKSQDLF